MHKHGIAGSTANQIGLITPTWKTKIDAQIPSCHTSAPYHGTAGEYYHSLIGTAPSQGDRFPKRTEGQPMFTLRKKLPVKRNLRNWIMCLRLREGTCECMPTCVCVDTGLHRGRERKGDDGNTGKTGSIRGGR